MYRKSIFTSCLILALALCTKSLWAQEKDALMQEVENKLYMREYAKAFRLLHYADSLNLNPKIVLKKHEIAAQFLFKMKNLSSSLSSTSIRQKSSKITEGKPIQTSSMTCHFIKYMPI
ncbi:MAG: hypothetical protein IPK03_05375 [Bacteroidetes bacterium]|nr:hypothetical protein [Bacteroidota bacterium]